MSFEDHFNTGEPHLGKLDHLDRPWAMLAHLSLLTAPFVPFAGPVVGPLAIIYTVGHREKAVHAEATRALNFGITFSVIWLGLHYYGFFTGKIHEMGDAWEAEFYLFLAAIPFVVLSACRNYKGWHSRYSLAIPWVRYPAPRRERRARLLRRRKANPVSTTVNSDVSTSTSLERR